MPLRSVTADKADQQIILQGKIHERDIGHGRWLVDAEFNRLCTGIKHMIQCLNVAAHGILLGADVRNDRFGSDISRIYHTSQIKPADNILEVHTVDLGNDLCI